MANQARSETEKQLCKDILQLELQTVKKAWREMASEAPLDFELKPPLFNILH